MRSKKTFCFCVTALLNCILLDSLAYSFLIGTKGMLTVKSVSRELKHIPIHFSKGRVRYSTARLSGSMSETIDETENYSMERLLERMDHFLAAHSTDCQLVVAVAGGGGHFLSTLSSTRGASAVLLEGTQIYHRDAICRYIEKDLDAESIKFCSSEAASLVASAALSNALKLCAVQDPREGLRKKLISSVSLGCSSALVSSSARKGRSSRAFITACLCDSTTTQMEVKLADSASTSRSRFDEDVFVSHCMLTCLEEALKQDSSVPLRRTSTALGDEIEMKFPVREGTLGTDPLHTRIEEVLSGERSGLCLVPSSSGFKGLADVVLPPSSILFPGSFNPVHTGHVELAKIAAAEAGAQFVWFELSVTNVDKPSLSIEDIQRRLKGFQELETMPSTWGVILTNSPMFVQKIDTLYKYFDGNYQNKRKGPLPVVIGSDTLVRLIDPKYYGDCEEVMKQSIQSMPCSFLVGGRLEQNNDNPRFITGSENVDTLPPNLQLKFTFLDGFRADVSSSDIRARKRD